MFLSFYVLDEFFRFSKKFCFCVFLVHPTMVLVLLSAWVERCFVGHMRDLKKNWMKLCWKEGGGAYPFLEALKDSQVNHQHHLLDPYCKFSIDGRGIKYFLTTVIQLQNSPMLSYIGDGLYGVFGQSWKKRLRWILRQICPVVHQMSTTAILWKYCENGM